jgi:hypothetical protein
MRVPRRVSYGKTMALRVGDLSRLVAARTLSSPEVSVRVLAFSTAVSLGLAAGAVALANPPAEAESPEAAESSTTATEAEATEAAKPDCSTLEGEAKATCEADAAKAAEPAEKAEEKTPAKGGKAKRSNTNRMEWVHEDE